MAVNPNRYGTADGTVTQSDIDAGLRSFFLGMYNYMALGLALTAGIALFIAMNQSLLVTLLNFPVRIGIFVALIGMSWFSGRIVSMKSMVTAQAYFWIYCTMWGLFAGPNIALLVNSTEGAALVARAFFITAGAFAGMSLYGYTTKKDLGPIGRFLSFACIGIILAVVVNAVVFQSLGFALFLSIGIVLVVAGMVAYETQMLKNIYLSGLSEEQQPKVALFGALTLYSSFVVIFLNVLNILGIMSGDD